MQLVITTERLVLFWDGWPSQWHPSAFEVGGVRYTCAEHFMMAEKARVFGDSLAEAEIVAESHPRRQKALGRRVQGFDVAVWNSVCLGVVFRGNLAKFAAHPELRERLFETAGKRMVEASPLDAIWGIGLGREDPRALDPASWQGTNWLGLVLDRVRDHLMAGLGVEDRCGDAGIAEQLERRARLAAAGR